MGLQHLVLEPTDPFNFLKKKKKIPIVFSSNTITLSSHLEIVNRMLDIAKDMSKSIASKDARFVGSNDRGLR